MSTIPLILFPWLNSWNFKFQQFRNDAYRFLAEYRHAAYRWKDLDLTWRMEPSGYNSCTPHVSCCVECVTEGQTEIAGQYNRLERHWPHRNVTAVRYGFGDMVLVPHGKFLSWRSWRGLRPVVHYIEVFTAGINQAGAWTCWNDLGSCWSRGPDFGGKSSSRNIRCTHEVCTQTYSWGVSAPLLWTCEGPTSGHGSIWRYSILKDGFQSLMLDCYLCTAHELATVKMCLQMWRTSYIYSLIMEIMKRVVAVNLFIELCHPTKMQHNSWCLSWILETTQNSLKGL